jgi:hypothetical protein
MNWLPSRLDSAKLSPIGYLSYSRSTSRRITRKGATCRDRKR